MADTDRELLELAAKAAGYSCWQSKHGYLNVTRPDGSTFTACHHWPKFDDSTGERLPEPTLADAVVSDNWNPLTDDGDEARLEAALGLNVRWRVHHVEVGRSLEDTWQESYALHGGDKQAARRRAGVSAAAEIGRAMP